jgi:hypothetical protein
MKGKRHATEDKIRILPEADAETHGMLCVSDEDTS